MASASHVQGERPKFQASDALVSHLLSGNYQTVSGGTMKMPAMQRPFEWDAGQCKKFVEQILSAFESNDWHSLGNIFLWRKDPDTTEVLVMDGAHRVTCIFILMAVLRHIRNTEFNRIKPQDIKPATKDTYDHAFLQYVCCHKHMSEGMFGLGAASNTLRFSPKAAQVKFFSEYILNEKDNLGALWDADAPPYAKLRGIDELEFADVVTRRYSVAANAMHQTMQAAMTRMLEAKPRTRNDSVKLACSVMERGKTPAATRGPWLLFEEFLVKQVSVALTVVTGGDLVTCCNMFLSANEVGKALSDLDRVKVRMLLSADGEQKEETMERWADDWDQTYLKLSKYPIAVGTELQNGTHASSNAFDELFVATIIGMFDPGLVSEHARKSSGRSDQSYVLERFLNERGKPPADGTFNVSGMPDFFDKWFKPNARALLTLFDWKKYGDEFDLAAGGADAATVLERAVMRDAIRGRLRSISEDFFSAYNRRETTYWLPVVAYMLRQFCELATMEHLDALLMHLHGTICWYMIVSGHNKKKAMGNYSKSQQQRGQSGVIPDLLRCFESSANPSKVKDALLGVLNGCREREGAMLVSKLATLTLEKNGAGPGADLQTTNMFLRIYEDTLRQEAFDKLPAADKTLAAFNARYSSVAQDTFNRALVREKGPFQAEHFIALKTDNKDVHASWTRTKKGVLGAFRTSIGNLCLVPQKVNISVSNEPPLRKVTRYKAVLGGIMEEAAPAGAAAARVQQTDDEADDDDDDDDEDDDDDDEAAAGGQLPAKPTEEESADAVAWAPDLERNWSLNDIVCAMGDGDLSTKKFGERLNRMHRAIMLHLGFSAADDLKACALSHFYTSDEKRLKNAPPPDLPDFPSGKQYQDEALAPVAPPSTRTRMRPMAAALKRAHDDDEAPQKEKPRSSGTRRKCL